MLVTGTLVYGKGDKLEARREGLLGEGEERLFAPVATADPGQAQPSAVPGAHRRGSGGTAPIAMRATPGSLKVRPAHPLHACWPCGPHLAPCICREFACAPHLLGLSVNGGMRVSNSGSSVRIAICAMPGSTILHAAVRPHPWLHAGEAMPVWLASVGVRSGLKSSHLHFLKFHFDLWNIMEGKGANSRMLLGLAQG